MNFISLSLVAMAGHFIWPVLRVIPRHFSFTTTTKFINKHIIKFYLIFFINKHIIKSYLIFLPLSVLFYF
jgi:hypothetical protein